MWWMRCGRVFDMHDSGRNDARRAENKHTHIHKNDAHAARRAAGRTVYCYLVRAHAFAFIAKGADDRTQRLYDKAKYDEHD